MLEFYIVLNKTGKFTGANNVLLVLGRETSAHREDCPMTVKSLYNFDLVRFVVLNFFLFSFS
jgi:hypothetical protein